MKNKLKKSKPKLSKVEREVFKIFQEKFGIKVFFGKDELEKYLKEQNLTKK